MSESNHNTLSEARLAANRENAQKSHGPVSDAGKAQSRLNAVKHGLTGATVLLTTPEDCQRYRQHTADYQQHYQPVGPQEAALVQSISDLWWRLSAIPVLELVIIAHGIRLLTETDPDFWAQPANQATLELEARRQNDKELRNLALQENRLARRRERETAELLRLQAERRANEEDALVEAAKASVLAKHRNQPLTQVPGLGFVFSEKRFATFMSRLTPAQREKLLQDALAEAAETPQTTTAAA